MDFFLKYGHNLLQMHLKLPQKKSIQQTKEITVALIGNNIADKITKLLKPLPENSSETVTNEA